MNIFFKQIRHRDECCLSAYGGSAEAENRSATSPKITNNEYRERLYGNFFLKLPYWIEIFIEFVTIRLNSTFKHR
jgi:hypothetical protein